MPRRKNPSTGLTTACSLEAGLVAFFDVVDDVDAERERLKA